MGGTILAQYRGRFSTLFRALLENTLSEDIITTYNLPEEITSPKKSYVTPMPENGLVHDYKFVKKGKGEWIPWINDLENAPPIPHDIPVNQIIVPTIETIRYLYLFKMLVQHQKPVLLVGPTGTGKSSYVSDFLLKKNDSQIYMPLFVTFSAQTTANQTQDIIMSKMNKRRKGIYGAPPGMRNLLYNKHHVINKCIHYMVKINMLGIFLFE